MKWGRKFLNIEGSMEEERRLALKFRGYKMKITLSTEGNVQNVSNSLESA